MTIEYRGTCLLLLIAKEIAETYPIQSFECGATQCPSAESPLLRLSSWILRQNREQASVMWIAHQL